MSDTPITPASTATTPAFVAGTATSLLALTTPFVRPPSCGEIFSTSSIVSSYWWDDYSLTTVQVLASDAADPRFASCQPPGWGAVVSASRFSFSPAVCPTGWTAYSVKALAAQSTTAYCCDRDYHLEWPVSDLSINGIASPACFVNLGTTLLPSSSSSVLFPNGIQVHNAWQIAWAASETSTLSPTPPQLACGRTLATWVPGEIVPPSNVSSAGDCQDDSSNSGVAIGRSLYLFLVVGLPLIFVAIFASCCVLCFRRRRRGARGVRGRPRKLPGN
ncbi:hypothetical protein B0T24DRAFT_618474 [Lasiosphaeria ovina]|uniref:Uncharacterized protein n=1 Tax=Lasiosphaeria ovina TaxID=92902 RepID=A0AAE0NAK8_9PEZI|nr:hypothetical protein B0T24DRAFT_618474 [Lasiosphaeria ovina]